MSEEFKVGDSVFHKYNGALAGTVIRTRLIRDSFSELSQLLLEKGDGGRCWVYSDYLKKLEKQNE